MLNVHILEFNDLVVQNLLHMSQEMIFLNKMNLFFKIVHSLELSPQDNFLGRTVPPVRI